MVRSTRAAARRAGASPAAMVVAAAAMTAIAVGVAALSRRGSPAEPATAAGSARVVEPRLVSLSPAITGTLAALGLGDRVVGRTPWCDGVPSAVPIVGSLQDFDAERIVRLRPTHLLVQPPAAGIDPGLAALAESNGWRLVAFALDGVADIDAMLADLPAAIASDGSDLRRELEAAATGLRAAMDAALVAIDADEPARRASGRILWLFAIDPPMAFGRGSYFDDVASALGLANAIDVKGYPELSLEDIQRARPDTIVLVRESPDQGGRGADALRSALGGLATPACRRGRLLVFADRHAMTPGAGVIELATALRGFLVSGAERGPAAGDHP